MVWRRGNSTLHVRQLSPFPGKFTECDNGFEERERGGKRGGMRIVGHGNPRTEEQEKRLGLEVRKDDG